MTRPRYLIRLAFIVVIATAAAAATVAVHGLAKKIPALSVPVEKTRLLMGTVVEIKVPLRDRSERARAEQAIDAAFGEIERIERVFSVYSPDSEVSRLNKLVPGKSMPVSPELLMVVEKAIEYQGKTNGAFDITIKPLKDLWQSAGASGVRPLQSAIDLTRTKVDAHAIALDRRSGELAFLKEGMAVDFGGIVKGYAADRAALILKRSGISSAIVSIGSGMYCLGGRPDGKPWTIAIQHPRDKKSTMYELAVRDKGVDTSGDYERYFTLAGKRYSHIIDPRSGLPVGDDVVSATVIAADSMTADIYATTLCVLGEEGLALVEAAGADALIIILENGRFVTKMTKDFEQRYGIGKKKF